MSLPRAGSSYPGYYPNLPTRPPDMAEIKGEYIEDCEGIKEEDTARLTPGPGAIPAEFLTRPSWPGSWPSSSAPALVTSHPMPGPRGHAPPGGLMPPLTTSLTPLQLIQKLSSYAATNRKRAAAPDIARSPQSPPSKRIPVSSPSFQPRIEQVMSLQCPDKSDKSQGREANNNSSSPPAAPDLAPTKSMIDCPVCGDIAVAHFHYGGMCCYSCKAFFRRVVNTNKVSGLL